MEPNDAEIEKAVKQLIHTARQDFQEMQRRMLHDFQKQELERRRQEETDGS